MAINPLPNPSNGDANAEQQPHVERAETDTAPLDISRMNTAVLAPPEVMANVYYWFPDWADDHDREAVALERQARRLSPQLASWEGSLISLWEHRDYLQGNSRRSIRDQALLNRTLAQIAELERQVDRLHHELVAIQEQARRHRAAAKQLRAQVLKMAREARQGGYWR